MTREFPYPFPERFRSRLMLHYRTRISGTEVKKKLPFRVLVLGNLTGSDAHAEPQDSQGQPKDPKAIRTVAPLDARPVHSYRFGKTGVRVDDFMGQMLPYAKLPKELVTLLPGKLKEPTLTGHVSSSARAGEKTLLKLSGAAEFVSSKDDNGLCEVRGKVTLAADVEVDLGTLPLTTEVTLRGGGLVRGMRTSSLNDEPIGVVAGIVRAGKATLTIERREDSTVVATLSPAAVPPGERRDRIQDDTDRVAKHANELVSDAKRQSERVNALTAPAAPTGVNAQIDAILQSATTKITNLLTDAKAAAKSYTDAAENSKEASGKVDTRAAAVPTPGAGDFEDKAKSAEGGVRQADVVLSAGDKAGSAARDAVETARNVVEEVKAAIQSATAKLGTLAGITEPSAQINLLAEVGQEVAAATGRIPSAATSIKKNKEDAEAAKGSVDMATFDASADASQAATGGDVPAQAERVLPFDSLSSFNPDEVVANVPELSRLRIIRELLLTLQAEVRNSPELRDTLLLALKKRTPELEALTRELAAGYDDLVIKKHGTP